jgi:tetratricopeptide (TPR) repeat protein
MSDRHREARSAVMILAAVALVLGLTPTAPALASTSVDNSGRAAAEVLTADDLYDVARMPRKVRKIVFRASAYAKRGDYEKAADLLFKHLADHPEQDHYLLRLHLAQHLADLGRPAEAMEHYRGAVDLQPNLNRGWLGLGDAAYDLERYEVAGEAFLAGYETSRERPAEVLYYAAASYLMADRPADALPLFERLVAERRGGAHLKWYQGLVIAAAGVGEPQRADAGIRQLMETSPGDPEAWFLSYQHHVGKQDFRTAAIALTVTGYLRDLSAPERKQLGDLYSIVEVPWLASREYDRAMAAAAEGATAADYERLVSSLVAAHESEAALSVLGKALIEDPSPRLVSLLGDIHYLRGDYAAASVSYARLADMGDETGRAYLMLGYCALEMGHKDIALNQLGRASTYEDQADMAQLLMQRALRMEG